MTDNGSRLGVQLGDAAGVETTGYISSTMRGGDNEYDTGYFAFNSDAAGSTYSGALTLTRSTGNKWMATGIIGQATTGHTITCAGVKTLSAELDRIRVLVASAGTFDAGAVNIVYE
jgi:hypothetical protein